jgi:hypothetical protein
LKSSTGGTKRGSSWKGGAQQRIALAGFAFGEQAEILARHLDGLLGEAGVLVAEQLDLGAVAGAAFTRRGGHVQAALAVLRNGEKEIERSLIGLETFGELLGRRCGVGAGDFEEKAVGHNAGGARDAERAGGQRFLRDLQRA